MTLFYYYGSGDLGAQAVRLGTGFRLTEAAEAGVVAMSAVGVDDPDGTVSIVGLKSFRVVETACSWQTLFRGFMADRGISRAASMLTGAARRWDTTVTDLNAALNFEVIRGTTGKRPAETDIERITWLLGSAYAASISDTGYVDTSGPVDLDPCDYRGRYAADVLADCAATSGKNYFVTWDESAGSRSLHYYAGTSSLWSSTVKISNVPGDADGLTVFAPDASAKLTRDPSRVYSGVYMEYGDGTASVYVSDSGTASTYAPRDTSTVDTTVSTAAKATARANKLQNQASTEYDRITVTLHQVPESVVNLVRVGQRMQVKFSHMPSYTSYTWIRVARRTVYQDGDVQGLYALDLELANTKAIRGKGGKGPRPNPEGTITYTYTDAGLLMSWKRATQGFGEALDPYTYNAGGSSIASEIQPNTAYTSCGCAVGCGGWGPGESYAGIYLEYTPTLPADCVGMRFTLPAETSTAYGVSNTGFLVGACTAEPTAVDDMTILGVWSDIRSDYVLDVPLALINDGGLSYIGVIPAWRCSQAAFFCAADLGHGCNGPYYDGEGNSGRITWDGALAPTDYAQYITVEGAGLTGWTSGVGAVNGSNRTFTLVDWDGQGVPRCIVNGLAVPTDQITFDADAGTAILDLAPDEGDLVLWRYHRAVVA